MLASQSLLAVARSLPTDGQERELRLTVLGRDAAAPSGASLADLHRRTGALMAEVARRLEPALQRALAAGQREWDQIDDVAVLDDALRAEAAAIGAGLASAPAEEPTRAEALLALRTAIGLAELVERRLASLVRLRLRSAETELIVDGRPFLPIAAALAEAARCWSS
jgi:hypothetical protein